MPHMMKLLCFLIPLLSCIIDSIHSHHLNVGTVLFTKADLCKKCWSEEERTLLIAREVMQGVLPDPDFMDITKAGTITVLMEYFQSCFEVISQSTCGKTQHLMFLALSDALGGYLRSYILPITRQAYYAGQIKYSEASKIFQFYDDIKDFLKANGVGWAKPRRFSLSCKIRPLKITTRGCDAACSQLYFKEETKTEICSPENEETSSEQAQTRTTQDLTVTKSSPSPVSKCVEGDTTVKQKLTDIIRGFKNQKYAEVIRCDCNENHVSPKIKLNGRNVKKIEKIRKNAKLLRDRLHWSTAYPPKSDRSEYMNNTSFKNMLRHLTKLRKRSDCSERKGACCPAREQIIPLPVLDDPEKPHAIGLPFKIRPLRSLDSPHAVCILVRYYITVIKCLVTKTNNRCDVCNFNGQFQAWLATYIFPHLGDEEWYPAFGGVLRIEETIKNIGYDECNNPNVNNDIGFMFSKGFAFDESDYLKNEECPEDESVPCCRVENRTYLTLGILAIVIIWITAFCYCICCHCPAVKIEPGPCKTVCADDEKKRTEPSSSYIVQCLIKFFKRAAAEENKKYTEIKKDDRDDGDETDLRDDSEIELANRPLSPMENHRRKTYDTPVRSEMRENRRRSGQGRETIVLPAQISPMNTELPLGLTSFWPFTDFRDDIEILKPYQQECSNSPLDRKETPKKRDKEQFKTIWRREKSVVQTSESCGEMGGENGNTGCKNEGSKMKEKVKLEEKPSSGSSYSDNSNSGGDNRKRVIFIRRSRSAFDYPGSYPYSYNSSANSYSSSQDDDIPMDLYDHIVACHNSFAKKPHQKSETESERDMTSTSSSASYLSPKRMP